MSWEPEFLFHSAPEFNVSHRFHSSVAAKPFKKPRFIIITQGLRNDHPRETFLSEFCIRNHLLPAAEQVHVLLSDRSSVIHQAPSLLWLPGNRTSSIWPQRTFSEHYRLIAAPNTSRAGTHGTLITTL